MFYNHFAILLMAIENLFTSTNIVMQQHITRHLITYQNVYHSFDLHGFYGKFLPRATQYNHQTQRTIGNEAAGVCVPRWRKKYDDKFSQMPIKIERSKLNGLICSIVCLFVFSLVAWMCSLRVTVTIFIDSYTTCNVSWIHCAQLVGRVAQEHKKPSRKFCQWEMK